MSEQDKRYKVKTYKTTKKQKSENPILAAVRKWLGATADARNPGQPKCEAPAIQSLLDCAPKRWVVYEPMALLPSGSFGAEPWAPLLASTSAEERDSLWRGILDGLSAGSREALTHLAVNEGIPRRLPGSVATGDSVVAVGKGGEEEEGLEGENVLRSPSRLRVLYGDFGPTTTTTTTTTMATDAGGGNSADDGAGPFERAFWVSTRQNGILQTWAPRWTMFSRGNVKEKARLLAFHDGGGGGGHDPAGPDPAAPSGPGTNSPALAALPGTAAGDLSRRRLPVEPLRGRWAVDLYAGIGYFVFSYASLGFRVLCWELNPWSVEGLRRGALRNGWAVKVVWGAADLARPTAELMGDASRIVVFLESNVEAARRIRELQERWGDNTGPGARGGGGGSGSAGLDIVHVNCGLLPTSLPMWKPAMEMVTAEGWLHLHENVGERDIGRRREEIQQIFDEWAREQGGQDRAVVQHTELVKTFAPEVRHCVFDVYVQRSAS